MKCWRIIYVFCSLLSLCSCKKDSGITELTALQDFSDLYRLEGTMKIQSNPVEEKPIQWIVTAADEQVYQIRPYGLHSNTIYRWMVSGIYSWPPAKGYFRFIVYGDTLQGNSLSDAPWKIAELDTIFQVNKELSFGTGFGQVELEFDYFSIPWAAHWSLLADNTSQKVKIEEVNDFEIHFPERKWVKQIVITFNAHLKSSDSANPLPDVELKNCRASLLISPNVE
ncbi:MAG: hypothetical protein LH618_17370 [Saprospiraceae bacterium]|nr:hypothetical protein [Saprospiraceae bacterium]